ncbi:ADP-forming succinate--CoA ligase subunit beta [Lutibaculum baratangense]|uniref:ADP-forming succinate--CoA ligase subunit beta n=1 Tax=Lutibaculum baratangense TaxID=1358440 RepID=UPI00058E1524|nr:ADP-forming succinate--CoA ligase subunit beta [Lutibaculum baratangense]
MNLHEFQAKEILARRGVRVPAGRIAWSAEEAEAVARELAAQRFAVKAQILAGGRGQAGGVKFAATSDTVRSAAQSLIGSTLVTRQTGPEGRKVKRVYVEEAVSTSRDIYVAALVDRRAGCPMLIGVSEGGEDVEERIARDENAVRRLPLPLDGSQPAEDDLRDFAASLVGQDGPVEKAVDILRVLASALGELDATLIEINPLALTKGGDLIVVDAKLTLDDNALFRHPDLQALRDEDEQDAVEFEAQRHDINFVRMDGDIGVVVNGAGLALATHDMLRDAGGAPANFMDIRTTATSLQIAKGIGLLLANPGVKVLLINVHGGGMTSCDTIVEALSIAMRWSGRRVPVVFRAAGQNAGYAEKMMVDRRIPHEAAKTIQDAVRLAVAQAGKRAA